jgi:hypothetical protein
MKNGENNLSTKKWLHITEEIMYRKLIGNTKALELEKLNKSLCNTKYKWDHKREKLVQNAEEEEEINVKCN